MQVSCGISIAAVVLAIHVAERPVYAKPKKSNATSNVQTSSSKSQDQKGGRGISGNVPENGLNSCIEFEKNNPATYVQLKEYLETRQGASESDLRRIEACCSFGLTLGKVPSKVVDFAWDAGTCGVAAAATTWTETYKRMYAFTDRWCSVAMGIDPAPPPRGAVNPAAAVTYDAYCRCEGAIKSLMAGDPNAKICGDFLGELFPGIFGG